MNFARMLVVARKEWTDAFRDRRAIYVVIFGVLTGPIMIAYLLNQLAGQQRAALEIQIPVVGRELAPVLVNWLEQQNGVELIAGPAEPEAAVRDRKVEFVLVIEKEFADKFRDSRPAPVQVISDSTRESARSKVRRLHALLTRFSSETGALRLVARGVSPAVVSGLKVEDVEVSTAQQRAATIFNIIPMFLILSAFAAGMQIATDSTAGERERGSLEPLLLNPVPRWQFVTGKWFAAAGAALLGMIATLVATAVVLSKLSLEDLGIRNHLGTPEILLLMAAVAPMALLAPAMQIYLACFAKSFKEAQSYMSFLILGAILPGWISIFHPLTNQTWIQPIPLLGSNALAMDIMGGKEPAPLILIAGAITSTVLAGVFLWLATRSFSSERIIFGR